MEGIYCLFSGGYDSSYLIHKILSDAEKTGKKDFELNLISVNGTFSPHKNDREANARKRLLDYWKAKYYNITINDFEIKFDTTQFSINSAKSGLSQPNLWLSALLTGVDTCKYDDIKICFSYICGDQALSYKNEIENIVYSSLKICNTHSLKDIWESDDKKIKVVFPIAVTFKEEIISQLIEEDSFVFENCTSCEGMEEYDLCNYCNPCRNLKSTLMNLINDNNSSQKVKDACQWLLDQFHKEEKDQVIDTVDKEE